MTDFNSYSAEMSSPAMFSENANQSLPGELSREDGSDQATHQKEPKAATPDRISFGSDAEERANVVTDTVKPSPSPTLSAQDEPGHHGIEPPMEVAGHPVLSNEGDQTSELAKPRASQSGRKPSRRKAGEKAIFLPEPSKPVPSPTSSPEGDHRAIAVANPRDMLPGGTSPASAGRDAANLRTSSNIGAPHHDEISDGQSTSEPQEESAVAGDDQGQKGYATHSTVAKVIAEITQLVRMRRRWQKAETALVLQGKALCRSWTEGDKDEANKLFDKVADGEVVDPILTIALSPFLQGRAGFTVQRLAIEKTLRKLAKSLPVWKSYAEGVKGFGDLRLAIIVGECGDIGGYRNPSCVWKRMGLAVIGGERQRRKTDADDAEAHGYNPERRAIAYVMSTELIKAQIRNVKDDDGKRTDQSIAIGEYGQLYLDRKAYEAGREGITKAHANNRAARYMVKRVLRDLYAAWRKAD